MSWIHLHRKIKDNWIWTDATKLKWWLDILLSVNHTPATVMIKGKLITCQKGQTIKSLETWARDWGTTKKTVHNFLNLLKSDGMIETQNLLVTTCITVCNYDSYRLGKTRISSSDGNGDDVPSKPKKVTTSKRKLHEQTNSESISYDKSNVNTVTVKDTEITRSIPPNYNEYNNTNTIVLVFDEKQKSEFEKFAEWIETHAPDLNRLKEPISIQQYWKLREHYKKIEITNMCEKMHNNANLTKKYKSAYITLKNWLKNETK
jgi:hypothetical protein